MDNATEQLAGGVWRIAVSPFLNVYLVANDGTRDAAGLTLVDAGTRNAGPRLVRSIRLLGFEPTAITDVVLTHWHADHMGSAARFAESSARPQVWVGRGDIDAVTGTNPRPHRGLPRGDLGVSARLASPLARPGPPVAAQPLDDGATLPRAPGATIVSCPGHTQGHVAVHLPAAGVLLAGDAVMNLVRLTRGFPPFRSCRSLEAESLRKLAVLDFDVLAVGHGPPVVSQAQARLRRLAQRSPGSASAAAT